MMVALSLAIKNFVVEEKTLMMLMTEQSLTTLLGTLVMTKEAVGIPNVAWRTTPVMTRSSRKYQAQNEIVRQAIVLVYIQAKRPLACAGVFIVL